MKPFDSLSPFARLTFQRELTAGIISSVFVGGASLLAVLMKKHFGASNFQLSIFETVSAIAFISSIWVNRWTEMISSRRLILVAGLIRTGLFALLGFARTPTAMILLFGMSQLTMAAIHPAMSRLWKANYDDRERLEAASYLNAIRSIFEMAMAYAITAAVDHRVELYRYLLPLAGISGALAQWCLSRIPFQGGEREEAPARTLQEHNVLVEYLHLLKRNRSLSFFYFLFFFYGLAAWIHSPLQVAYLEDMLRLSYKQFSLVLFIVPQVITMLTYPILARFINRIGIFTSWFAFSLIEAVHLLIMMFGTTLDVFLVAKALKGFVNGGTSLLWAVGVLNFSQNRAEIRQFAALHLTFTGVRALIGPLIGLATANYFGTGAIFTMSFIVNGVALLGVTIHLLNRHFPKFIGVRQPSNRQI